MLVRILILVTILSALGVSQGLYAKACDCQSKKCLFYDFQKYSLSEGTNLIRARNARLDPVVLSEIKADSREPVTVAFNLFDDLCIEKTFHKNDGIVSTSDGSDIIVYEGIVDIHLAGKPHYIVYGNEDEVMIAQPIPNSDGCVIQ